MPTSIAAMKGMSLSSTSFRSISFPIALVLLSLYLASFFLTCAGTRAPRPCFRPVTLSHVLFESDDSRVVTANVLLGSLLFQMVFASVSQRHPVLGAMGMAFAQITLVAWTGPELFYNVLHIGGFAGALLSFAFAIPDAPRACLFLAMVIFLAGFVLLRLPVVGVVLEACLGLLFVIELLPYKS